MSETVLDVLMYLFETYSEQDLEQDLEQEPEPDQSALRDELLQAGFGELEVDGALDWLEGLSSRQIAPFAAKPAERSIRLFHEFELSRLDAECRGYILYLEQIGILSPIQREIVIDRLVALGSGDIDVEQVKWVVLMVLFSQPGQEKAFARMEDLVFEENTGLVN
jgi:Smg protein